jgi:hypothetical protein
MSHSSISRSDENIRASARGSTVSQLRDDIDSGRTGDKVDWSDPAAAPLGTDAEAAGTPASPEMLTAVRAAENSRSVDSASHRWQPGAAWVLVALVLVIVAVLIGWIAANT